jgi:hypothetical protein
VAAKANVSSNAQAKSRGVFEQVFDIIGEEPEAKTCNAFLGITPGGQVEISSTSLRHAGGQTGSYEARKITQA